MGERKGSIKKSNYFDEGKWGEEEGGPGGRLDEMIFISGGERIKMSKRGEKPLAFLKHVRGPKRGHARHHFTAGRPASQCQLQEHKGDSRGRGAEGYWRG